MRIMGNTVAGRRSAFTLVELLAVVAIIGILAALSYAGIRQALVTGRASKCLGQLRQIGIASQQFAAENRGATPGQNWMYPYLESAAATRGTLASYLNTPARWTDYAESVMTCPELQVQFPSKELGRRTYTLNGLCVSRDETTGDPLAALTSSNQPRTLRLSDSTFPARQVFFFDGLPNVQNQSSGEWAYLARGFSSDVVSYGRFVHEGMANVVFLDGHCEKLSRNEFLSHSATNVFWTGR
jgi:prepilin-type N-terminal cleavage/methylation domain-containing protein/prepilin-type processing-associated H-X9-DG protein